MALRKRARETDIKIRVASDEPLEAESYILRSCSTCARELPVGADEWDVSGLLLNGEPFSSAAVKCWLSCAHSVLSGQDELDEEDTALISTAQGLCQLLAFAHAIGSSGGVMNAVYQHIDKVKFVVQLPQQTMELQLRPGAYFFPSRASASLQLGFRDATTCAVLGSPCSSHQEKLELQKQLTQQTGELLRLAHVLRLQPLIKRLNEFIRWQAVTTVGVLHGLLELVFTDAVLDTVLGSSTLGKEAYITSVLTLPCCSTGSKALFKPEGEVKLVDKAIHFEARLLQDFAGMQRGDQVNVTVDLFHTQCPYITIGDAAGVGAIGVTLSAGLLLGTAVTSEAQLAEAMSLGLTVLYLDPSLLQVCCCTHMIPLYVYCTTMPVVEAVHANHMHLCRYTKAVPALHGSFYVYCQDRHGQDDSMPSAMGESTSTLSKTLLWRPQTSYGDLCRLFQRRHLLKGADTVFAALCWHQYQGSGNETSGVRGFCLPACACGTWLCELGVASAGGSSVVAHATGFGRSGWAVPR